MDTKNIKIIDTHCHIYPEKIAAKAVAGTDAFYGTVALCKGTLNDLIEEDKKAGIAHSVIHSVATTPKQVEHINDFIAASESAFPDKFTGLGTLHPDSEDIEKDFGHILDLKLHGVKLHPDIQKFQVDDKKCDIIYTLCSKYKLPLLMHTGDKRYDNSNPDRVERVLKKFPDLTLVGAHYGGWSLWGSAYKTLAKYPNFYTDCSSSFYMIDRETAIKATEGYTPDKVMFASDFPMWCPKIELDIFLSLGFSDEEYRKMLYKNAQKVFGIKL